MLSILIPIYNFNVLQLVSDLQIQAREAGIAFEIIAFDDGSDQYIKIKNRPIAHLENVQYQELPKNLGRSKIRNELAKSATYEYLLFMDCDSKVVSKTFIQTYIKHLNPEFLLYGGRVYQNEPPADLQLKFHWHYGIQREQVAYQIRQQRPYHAFQTNNFLVPKKIFLEILFDENLKQYGHEDTLFGFELKNRNIPILHIDNPLEHIGLERVEVFLAKTEKGIQNLLSLHREYPFIETKLLSVFKTCKRTGLSYPLKALFPLVKPGIERNLRSKHPKLRYFDFYKLGLMLMQ